jgi:hypothetical protein
MGRDGLWEWGDRVLGKQLTVPIIRRRSPLRHNDRQLSTVGVHGRCYGAVG